MYKLASDFVSDLLTISTQLFGSCITHYIKLKYMADEMKLIKRKCQRNSVCLMFELVINVVHFVDILIVSWS